jgi:hypothetical protein
MLTSDQLNSIGTAEGSQNIIKNTTNWSTNAKGEVLLGLWRFRLGYQFMYNFSEPTTFYNGPTPVVDSGQFTTYFNSSRTQIFAHYFLAEFAIINGRHFGLVPGIALGSYNGFRIDNNTGEKVPLSDDTYHRFSMGAELNAEFKFGRCAILLGPNYYLFSLQDKANNNWREYQHLIGADVGFRVNLL